MNKKKQKRFAIFAGAFVVMAGAVGLTLMALSDSVTYFYLPSELVILAEPPERSIRLGGLVAAGSVQHLSGDNNESLVSFDVTDGNANINVSYEGILPDLFREGQGVVVQGRLEKPGFLKADNVLAKHDENYMPKEVTDALKEQGRWKEGSS